MSRKLITNSFLNSLTFILPTISLLFLTPFFVRYLGDEWYGLWMLAMSVLGLAGTLEFGLGVATTKYVAEYAAVRDSKGLSTIYTLALVLYTLIGTLAGSILFLFSSYIVRWFTLSNELVPYAIISIKIISLAILPSLAIGSFTSIPRGLQRYKFPTAISIVLSVGSSFGAFLLIILFDVSIVHILIWVVFLHWILLISSVIIAWKMLKPYQVKLRVYRSYLKNILSFTGYASLANIGGKIFTSGDRLFVGSLLGVSHVTYYSVVIGLANKVFYLAGSLTQAIMPKVSELEALQNKKDIYNLFQKATNILALFSTLIGSALFICSERILIIWMGEEFTNVALGPFRILIVIYTLLAITPVAYFVSNGIGYPNVAALGSFGGGLAMLLLMYPTVKLFHLEGAALSNMGYLFSFLPMGFIIRYFKRSIFIDVFGNIWKYIGAFFIFAAFTLLLSDSTLWMLVLLVLLAVLYLYFVWFELSKVWETLRDTVNRFRIPTYENDQI